LQRLFPSLLSRGGAEDSTGPGRVTGGGGSDGCSSVVVAVVLEADPMRSEGRRRHLRRRFRLLAVVDFFVVGKDVPRA
jgi:hypothetical protein